MVLSSFGVMFFDDPAAAFANLRKALRPGGRLAFLCWRTREENPIFTTGFAEAAALLGLREQPGPSAAFSLADTVQVSALLSVAGSPTAAEILTGLSPAHAAELTRQVRDRFLAYASPAGVTMPGAAWLVTTQAV